jgi:hypothetical protein
MYFFNMKDFFCKRTMQKWHLIEGRAATLPSAGQYDSVHSNLMLGNFPNVQLCCRLVTLGGFYGIKSPPYSPSTLWLNNLESAMLVINPVKAGLNPSV